MKIFIYALEMTVGGVEKALLGQLTHIRLKVVM